jgi:ribosome-associated protein
MPPCRTRITPGHGDDPTARAVDMAVSVRIGLLQTGMARRADASGHAGGMAPSSDDLTTARGLRLPASALFETFARGSGPGGQHRNVTASAVELVADLNALEGPGASRARAVLGEEIRVRSDDSRSQWRNRSIARDRLAGLIDEASVPVTPRRPTRPSRGARQRRLDAKGRTSARKRDRSWRPGDDA